MMLGSPTIRQRCSICRSTLLHLGTEETSASTSGFRVRDLEQSHRTGCEFCGILIKAIQRKFSDSISGDPELFMVFRPTEGTTLRLSLFSYEADPYDGIDIYICKG